MASFGFTVLRFETRYVFLYLEYLKSEIRKVLNKRKDSIGKINQPPRPDTAVSGHLSLKRRACPASAGGNFFYSILQKTMLKLTPMGASPPPILQ
jgi:hypothetical protein